MEPPNGCTFSFQERQMSARKLGRLAGLVFVLAAVFGGIGAATVGNEAGGSAAATSAIHLLQFESTWG
jgi:hypothetical protein